MKKRKSGSENAPKLTGGSATARAKSSGVATEKAETRASKKTQQEIMENEKKLEQDKCEEFFKTSATSVNTEFYKHVKKELYREGYVLQPYSREYITNSDKIVSQASDMDLSEQDFLEILHNSSSVQTINKALQPGNEIGRVLLRLPDNLMR